MQYVFVETFASSGSFRPSGSLPSGHMSQSCPSGATHPIGQGWHDDRLVSGCVPLGQILHCVPLLANVSPCVTQLWQWTRCGSGSVPFGQAAHGNPKGDTRPLGQTSQPVRPKLGCVPGSHDSHGCSGSPVLCISSPRFSHDRQTEPDAATTYCSPALQLDTRRLMHTLSRT